MNNTSNFNKTLYSFEFPIQSTSPHLSRPTTGVKCIGIDYATIEECVDACKAACTKLGMNYDDHDVKLFMIDADGEWEVSLKIASLQAKVTIA